MEELIKTKLLDSTNACPDKEDMDYIFQKQIRDLSNRHEVRAVGDFNFPRICWETFRQAWLF